MYIYVHFFFFFLVLFVYINSDLVLFGGLLGKYHVSLGESLEPFTFNHSLKILQV